MNLSVYSNIHYLLVSPILQHPPNIISLLYKIFPNKLTQMLHQWEDLAFSIIIATFVIILFRIGIRKREMIPKGLQNGLEMITELLMKVIYGILGSEEKKYIPFLGTLFVYILALNLFGLIPLMKPPSANLNTAIALALCVFTLVQYLNIKHMGIFGFLYHMAGSPKTVLEWIIVPLIFPLELLTQISRPVTLALRLFGNIMGEEALIGYFTLAGVAAFSLLDLPMQGGLPLQIPFMFLGILTSFMQALVFTLLSAVYILLSIPHKEKHQPKI
ncbi:ATP synthase subunit a [Waddlia chondrophila 2032/99]|uniref:ATP synthase subunit a n=2 Tax=Waddlia chondrophila TaxID=71667 RepID=D6YWG8_WADCW|nr:F0F1 ATP synthase subunit A [Waddlia chondrophila]ADI38479.1 F-type ATP synthase, subunit a [Waddlia chondrophila WSU 86-1044]CCB91561.1 ATP synthase subunit a [Waddlia chondrophila 2032/99]